MAHPHLLSQTFHRIGGAAACRGSVSTTCATHATLLLKAGVPLKVVSERLGHSLPAFMMCVYQHVLPGMLRDAADLFGRILTVGFSPRQATSANPMVLGLQSSNGGGGRICLQPSGCEVLR